MWIRQIFGASRPPKYLTHVDSSNIWGVYTPKIFEWLYVRQMFGGSTPPKYLTDVCPSNICGVYTPKIFDGCGYVKYLRGLHPQSI